MKIGTTSEENNYWASLMFGVSREGAPSLEDPLGYYYCTFVSNSINCSQTLFARVGNETSVTAFLEGPGASLPDLEYVNGLTREAFTAAALGFVKTDGFSAIEVKDGEAKLDVVIGRADSLEESAEWTPVSTNEVSVPAPGEQGFFIVVPASLSDRIVVTPPKPIR